MTMWFAHVIVGLKRLARLGLAFALAAAILQAKPLLKIPLILDTDIGADIDDAFALALIISSPELELLGVTAVGGDTQARARLAAKMLWEAGGKCRWRRANRVRPKGSTRHVGPRASPAQPCARRRPSIS